MSESEIAKLGLDYVRDLMRKSKNNYDSLTDTEKVFLSSVIEILDNLDTLKAELVYKIKESEARIQTNG